MSFPRSPGLGLALRTISHGERTRSRIRHLKHTRRRIAPRNSRKRLAAPLAAIQDKARGVDGIASPFGGISSLSLGKTRRGIDIFPSQIVPVVHMERYRHKFLPQSPVTTKRVQPIIGRRTTRTAFGAIQFNQAHPSRPAFEGRRQSWGAEKYQKEDRKVFFNIPLIPSVSPNQKFRLSLRPNLPLHGFRSPFFRRRGILVCGR